MRILLAVDGSEHADQAIADVSQRPWPAGSEVEVLSVVQPRLPTVAELKATPSAAYDQLLEQERHQAAALVESVAARLQETTHEVRVSTRIREGDPRDLIVDEAGRWGADVIVMGSHGRSAVGRLLLGSVSHAVALHAPCSVQIVRRNEAD
jgi:nucleotide-binding universal stress UspA family protein